MIFVIFLVLCIYITTGIIRNVLEIYEFFTSDKVKSNKSKLVE